MFNGTIQEKIGAVGVLDDFSAAAMVPKFPKFLVSLQWIYSMIQRNFDVVFTLCRFMIERFEYTSATWLSCIIVDVEGVAILSNAGAWGLGTGDWGMSKQLLMDEFPQIRTDQGNAGTFIMVSMCDNF